MVKTSEINTELLEEYIVRSGLRIGYICEQLGISRQAFDLKRKGKTAFRQSEVYALCAMLGIEDNAVKIKIFYP